MRWIFTSVLFLANVVPNAVASQSILDPPSSFIKALSEANTKLSLLGECLEAHSSSGSRRQYDQLQQRFDAALGRAQKVWGKQVITAISADLREVHPTGCSRKNTVVGLKSVGALLDRSEHSFDEATNGMRLGAWAGPLKLCRDNVETTKAGTLAVTEQPTLEVKLRPQVVPVLAAITERSVGLPLAIRLNGVTVSEPIINEKIEGGAFEIAGGDETVLKRLQQAIGAGC